jgi:hypothetical protein
MSFNTVDNLILDTETFATAVAEEMAVIEADKAELIARSKREAAIAVATETAATVAIANAEADEAERLAHVKREAVNAASAALFASKIMVESGFTGITVDDDEHTTVDARTAAGRTHESKAARKAERKATMKARYCSNKRAAKTAVILLEKEIAEIEAQRWRDWVIQARAREEEVQMRASVETELRRGLGGGRGRGGGGTNAGVVACFMAGTS